MSSLCVLDGGIMQVIAATAFTLSWSHSVEKTKWVETWQVVPAGLTISEARIKGSGAGMDPPEGSRLIDGWYVYTPKLSAQPRIVLANSGLARSVWRLCANGKCRSLGTRHDAGTGASPSPIVLSVCDGASTEQNSDTDKEPR